MKIIAYFLPQFHSVKENNEWWEENFTEWTNLKKAKKLYNNHEQPIKPLSDNYYNLLNKKTVEWQTELLNEYGLYGLCYYHYWFSGRKILEKPAENLLNWKDIEQKFCFCWANHNWKKTWDGTSELLIEQTYGDKTEWKEHFDYLIKFFNDERYIKDSNKPILIIYNSKDIPQLDERIKFYDDKCKKNGFDGIFIIESLNSSKANTVSEISNGVVLREPSIGMFLKLPLFDRIEFKIKRKKIFKFFTKPKIFKAENIYRNSLNFFDNYISEKKIMCGSFAFWDSTPRHGKRGCVVSGTIEKFEHYLMEQKKIMEQKSVNYLFFNAWNEWAEGMYLEPDEKNGYKYLEVIKKVFK